MPRCRFRIEYLIALCLCSTGTNFLQGNWITTSLLDEEHLVIRDFLGNSARQNAPHNNLTLPIPVRPKAIAPIDTTTANFDTIHSKHQPKTSTLDEKQANWLSDYVSWHSQMRQTFPDTELLYHPEAPPIFLSLMNGRRGGGIADRMMGLGHLLKLCHEQGRVLLIKWLQPKNLEVFLQPQVLNWTMPAKIKPFFSVEEYHPELFGNNQTAKLLFLPGTTGNIGPAGNFSVKHVSYREIWNTLFRPTAWIQQKVDAIWQRNQLEPGQYDAVHCRIRHPAHLNNRELNEEDKKGLVLEGDRKQYAMATAIHALHCSNWLTEQHQRQDSERNAENNPYRPIYFYSDSPELVMAITDTFSSNNGTATNQTTTTNKTSPLYGSVVSQGAAVVAHIDDGRGNDNDIEAYASSFVDLYVALNARCITMGVGRFAYLAAQISGTNCLARHETPSNPFVVKKWGMSHIVDEIMSCPI